MLFPNFYSFNHISTPPGRWPITSSFWFFLSFLSYTSRHMCSPILPFFLHTHTQTIYIHTTYTERYLKMILLPTYIHTLYFSVWWTSEFKNIWATIGVKGEKLGWERKMQLLKWQTNFSSCVCHWTSYLGVLIQQFSNFLVSRFFYNIKNYREPQRVFFHVEYICW